MADRAISESGRGFDAYGQTPEDYMAKRDELVLAAEHRREVAERALADREKETSFAEAWAAATAHGLVDEFSNGLDGEEAKLRSFLAQLGGVGRRAIGVDAREKACEAAWAKLYPDKGPLNGTLARSVSHTIAREMFDAGYDLAHALDDSKPAPDLLGDEAVEAAAKAIFDEYESDSVFEWASLPESERIVYRVLARAALSAARSTSERDGER